MFGRDSPVIFLPIVLALLYINFIPFTKVEESFNMQATHDIIYHGSQIDRYDHVNFPGPVPRTFFGAITLAVLAKLPVMFFSLAPWAPLCNHTVGLNTVRNILAMLSFLSFDSFRMAFSRHYGTTAANFLILLTCCQFHLLYYSSRTLPNTFALNIVYLALAQWLHGRIVFTLLLFTFAIVVFRADTAVLFAPVLLSMLLRKEVTVPRMVLTGFLGTIAFAGLTILVDSMFWGRWVWPEFEVLVFNTVLNKSKEWGTSPFHWYFTNALPKALLAAYPMFFFAFWQFPRFRPYSGPAVAMVVLYSFLPHKELRFIFAALPLMNAHVAMALANWYNSRGKSPVRRLWWYGCLLGFALSAVAVGFGLWASYHNYPGGTGLHALHSYERRSPLVKSVHIDVFSSMNGITRFQKDHCGGWRYSKDPGFIGHQGPGCPPYSHLITSVPANHTAHYQQIGLAFQFLRFTFQWPWPQCLIHPTVVIMGLRPEHKHCTY